jgi:hypothetical protein
MLHTVTVLKNVTLQFVYAPIGTKRLAEGQRCIHMVRSCRARRLAHRITACGCTPTN